MNLQLGSFRRELIAAGLPDIERDHVSIHSFSVRTPLIREGAFDQSWMPAVTLGVHYKANSGIDMINRRLGGALRNLGVRSGDSLEFTLSATKSVAGPFGRPTIVTVGGRATEAVHAGFLGFTDRYRLCLETSVIYLITDQLALAAEYRMKPDRIREVGTLIKEEDDWWDVGLAYVFNEHLTATAAYVRFGNVLDEDVDGGFIFAIKYEF
jgi:hypothetical protein